MAKYICLKCGNEFDEPAEWEEYRGECFGVPAYEPVEGCPICHGDFMTKEEYLRDIIGKAWDDDDDEYEFDPRNADCESQ